jgi:hypothetical protein
MPTNSTPVTDDSRLANLSKKLMLARVGNGVLTILLLGALVAYSVQQNVLHDTQLSTMSCLAKLQSDATPSQPDSKPVADQCPNIPGVQVVIPNGYHKDANGNCVVL